MPDPSGCPTEQQWADFLAGQVPPAVAASVRTHLDECSRCAQVVHQLQAGCPSRDTGHPPTAAPETPWLPGGDEAVDSDDASLLEERFDASLLERSENSQALGRLGKYDVLKVLGYGGMGVALQGLDTQLCRPVAIKLLNRQLASRPTARRRFLREARAAAAVNHPNVVTIFAVEEYRDTPIIVMELVAGCTLRECIRRARQLDPIEALRISSQVAAGLAAAHAQGVIHRDVKPGNILLEDKLGRVKLTDFGVARAALDNVDLTTQGVVVGTPAYMAPEQVRGEKVDVRADLFALGCVMYSMFTGRSPFHAGSCWEAAHRVTEFEPPPLHEKDPAVPAFLSEIIVRLLKKQPEERFQSAAEVAELLQRHLMLINQAPSDELDAVLHGRRQPEESPLSKRRPVAWVVAGIAALLLLPVLATVVIGYWLHGDSQTPAPKPSGVAVKGSTRERVPRTISVAKDGSGDVQTIAEALGRATPGTLIRVQDDAVYEEAVGIEGADRFAGVNLVSDSGATLAAPASGAFAVLFIKNAPRVTVRGFQIRPAASGHGVAILGACPGVRLESCRVAASSAEHWALIYVTEDAAGTTEQPIVVQAATVEAQTLGIVIQGAETGQAVAHVQVRNSRFAGPGQHVQLNRFVDDVSLVGNTFLGGTAVICNLNATSAAGKVTITNNTFFENGCWLGFGQTSLEGHHLAVRNNLIVGAKGMQAGVHAAADFTHAWSFSHNLWEPATDSDPAVVALVATPVPAVRLVSREAGQLDFLRPTADSQAATSGAGGDLPSYVGAFPPVSSR